MFEGKKSQGSVPIKNGIFLTSTPGKKDGFFWTEWWKNNHPSTMLMTSNGEGEIRVGDVIYKCPSCSAYHGQNQECKQGQAP